MSIDKLAQELQPYLVKVSEQGRRELAVQIAKELRRSQSSRIRKQQNPDGSKYASRKKASKKKLFSRIRTYSFLKNQITDSSIAIAFFGRIARIANVHQHGQIDRPAKSQAPVRYPKRELLGFSDDDIRLIEDISRKFLQF